MFSRQGFILITSHGDVIFVDGFTGEKRLLRTGDNSISITGIGSKSSFIKNSNFTKRFTYDGHSVTDYVPISTGSVTGTYRCSCLSRDGTKYARRIDGTVLISNVSDDTITDTVTGLTTSGGTIDISPDNQWLCCLWYSDNNVKLIKISDNTIIDLPLPQGLSAGFNAAGDRILAEGMNTTKLFSWDGSNATFISEDASGKNNIFYRNAMWTTNGDFFTTSSSKGLSRYDKDFNLLSSPANMYQDPICITNTKTNSALVYKDTTSQSEICYFIPDVDNYRIDTLIPVARGVKYVDTWNTEDKYKVDISFTDNSEETDFKALVYDLRDNLIAKKRLPSGTTSDTIKVPTPEPVKVVISGIPDRLHQTDHDYEVNDIITVNDTNRSYICTTAGTTANTKPAYPDTSGATITDGTAVFTERGKLAQPVVIYPLNPTVI